MTIFLFKYLKGAGKVLKLKNDYKFLMGDLLNDLSVCFGVLILLIPEELRSDHRLYVDISFPRSPALVLCRLQLPQHPANEEWSPQDLVILITYSEKTIEMRLFVSMYVMQQAD